MKEPGKDDERLSALLDGRLGAHERRELLAHLATSDDDYEVFADTAAFLRAQEEAVRPMWRVAVLVQWPRRQLQLLAAVLAVLILGGALVWRARVAATAAAVNPVRLAARLEHAEEGLPEGWTERPRWPAERGGGTAAVLPPEQRAINAARAGVLLVDLAVAVEARDAGDTRVLSEQVRVRFDAGLGRGGPLHEVSAHAGEPAASLTPQLAEATERIAGRFGKEPFRLGAWTEAARLAAHRHDEAFFRARASRSMLKEADRLTQADAAAYAAVQRLRAALPPEGAPAWDALQDALDALLREIAS